MAKEFGFDVTTEFPALPGWKPPYEMMPVGSDLRLTMRRPA